MSTTKVSDRFSHWALGLLLIWGYEPRRVLTLQFKNRVDNREMEENGNVPVEYKHKYEVWLEKESKCFKNDQYKATLNFIS